MINYRLHLIRHGATRGNYEGRYIGRTDLPLCEQGVEELEALKCRYVYPPVEMVAAGPLTRCTQSAGILYPDTYLEQWEEFTECDFGAFEGKSVTELRGSGSFQEWVAGGMASAPPGGESAGQLTARVVRGMERLVKRIGEEGMSSVALITHGGVIASLLYGMGLPRRGVAQCAVGSGRGYTVLLNTQLWMRDRIFEIHGIVPHGLPESGVRDWIEGGAGDGGGG